MHRFLVLLMVSASIFLFIGFCKTKNPGFSPSLTNSHRSHSPSERERLKTRSESLLHFARQKGYNTAFAFLVDMKIPSGSNRFFVYDLKNDSVLLTGLVTHGSGTDNSSQIIFSNKAGSYCSSLGRYKVGASYNGKFGLAYKIYGLDSSNSNAFNRFIVLHSHACVPETEVQPQAICESWGCPTVAPGFLDKLRPYIDKSEKPILLQVFN